MAVGAHALPGATRTAGVSGSARVRLARLDDADHVVRAHRLPHAVGNVLGPSSARFVEVLEDERRLVAIIETDDGPVGTFMLTLTDPSWLVELSAIVMSDLGRGYGAVAVRWLVDHVFRVLHAHRITLEVVASNRRARRLYESAGFVHEGTWRDGFCDDDGGYRDLRIYGMLEKDGRS